MAHPREAIGFWYSSQVRVPHSCAFCAQEWETKPPGASALVLRWRGDSALKIYPETVFRSADVDRGRRIFLVMPTLRPHPSLVCARTCRRFSGVLNPASRSKIHRWIRFIFYRLQRSRLLPRRPRRRSSFAAFMFDILQALRVLGRCRLYPSGLDHRSAALRRLVLVRRLNFVRRLLRQYAHAETRHQHRNCPRKSHLVIDPLPRLSSSE